MNQKQYNELQLLLADMISVRNEDPNTEGYAEAIQDELDYYIHELSQIFKVPIPNKTRTEILQEIFDCNQSKEFYEKINLE